LWQLLVIVLPSPRNRPPLVPEIVRPPNDLYLLFNIELVYTESKPFI